MLILRRAAMRSAGVELLRHATRRSPFVGAPHTGASGVRHAGGETRTPVPLRCAAVRQCQRGAARVDATLMAKMPMTAIFFAAAMPPYVARRLYAICRAPSRA